MQTSKQASTYLHFCILSALSMATLSATAAEIDRNDDALPQVELDKITVTATRTPTKISNTIAQTRVIDSEELKRYQGQTVLEVIKRQPGFSYYTNGGMGTSNNFYVRGYDSKQVLVLIDGIRYSSLSLGTPALNLLSADQIDRIEVLYGASGSSIYGADAMGGVIQVFTKGANVDKTNFSVTAGLGSHDQYSYGASAQFANDSGTTMSIGASRNQTDGFNATQPSAGKYTYNPDDDGFKSNNFSASLNQRINDQWLAGTSAIYSKSTSDFDAGVGNAFAKQENGAAQAFVDWRYLPGSSLKLQYGHSIDKSDNPTYQSVYNTKQDQINLIGQHKLPVGQGIYGLEYLNQGIDTNQYHINDRDVKSAFLGYVLASSRFDAQANLRFDDNSQYGDKTTYNLGGAYHVSPEFRVGANYAKGFRAPTFNDLYYPGSGNLNLTPETSDNYEAFAEFNTANQVTRLTGYHNKVDDLIGFIAQYDDKGEYVGGSSENFDKAKIKGITLTSDWVIDDYLLGASYDYQQAKDSSSDSSDGNFLPIRPEHKGLIYVGYRLPSVDLRAEYQYVGNYFSNVQNLDSQRVDSYGLFNISGNYQLSNHLSMSARLNNVTNKKYVTLPNYNTDGTNFFTALTYNWF